MNIISHSVNRNIYKKNCYNFIIACVRGVCHLSYLNAIHARPGGSRTIRIPLERLLIGIKQTKI